MQGNIFTPNEIPEVRQKSDSINDVSVFDINV